VPFYNPLPGTFLCFYPAANNCGFTVALTVGSDKSIVFKFDEDGYLQFYSHRKKRILTMDEIQSEGACFSIPYEKSLRGRFTAKVALASGYFVYGSDFVENVKTEELRALMNYSGKQHDKDIFNDITTTGWFWAEQVKKSDISMHGVFQLLNDVLNTSFVALITSAVPDRILIVVGVLGELTGVISCPANCDSFPKTGDYDLGHVVILRKNGVQRLSYRSCLHLVEKVYK
jgi:hypothetical protein